MKCPHATYRFLVQLLCPVLLGAAEGAMAQSNASSFDGAWNVVLVCDDVRDAGSFVKGYTYEFNVAIKDGVMQGEYSKAGIQGSVKYVGTVASNGDIRIQATGKTGDSGYSVGHVSPGRPYSYTLSGKLSGNSGRAIRQELRSCIASFNRSQ